MNRLKYDSCAYDKELKQSTDPLSYIINPIKYDNCTKCRMELGIVGGTSVSHITGNLVDLENDLRGQTRPNTHCPTYLYTPPVDGKLQGKEYIKPVTYPVLDTNSMVHLKPCQMINYGAISSEPVFALSRCG
jgi:hypothetical protein